MIWNEFIKQLRKKESEIIGKLRKEKAEAIRKYNQKIKELKEINKIENDKKR